MYLFSFQDGDVLDVMVSGKKVVAIFGFCDIRKFSYCTEALDSHVMMFVNEVAAIVHEMVHKYEGAANKNIGNAFLCIWKPNTMQIKRACE